MRRRLIADTKLETSRAPIDELYGALGLDGGHSSLDILGDDITTVQETASHCKTVRMGYILRHVKRTVFALLGVALNHLIAMLEAREGHIRD